MADQLHQILILREFDKKEFKRKQQFLYSIATYWKGFHNLCIYLSVKYMQLCFPVLLNITAYSYMYGQWIDA